MPSEAVAQLRRDPALQPVPDVRRGELLIGLGAAIGFDAAFPLSGLSGDLASLGRLTFAYGLGDGALLEIRGDAWRVLSIDERGESRVPLDPGVEDGRTADAGDFRIGLLFTPIGARTGFAAGGHLEVKLPNSDEAKGIGSNTTDVRLAALASWGGARWRATGSLGVAILEAPLESFEQNDVLAYAAEVLVDVGSRVRLALGLDGRAATRDRVFTGTEDLGALTFGADWRRGPWIVDAGVSRGLVSSSADWSVGLGLSWSRLSVRRSARARERARRRRR